MQNWLFRETRNFVKQPVSFAKQRNSFRIEFRETKSETSFAGNPNFTYVKHCFLNEKSSYLYKNYLFDTIKILFLLNA
jgi:hypothetical protein